MSKINGEAVRENDGREKKLTSRNLIGNRRQTAGTGEWAELQWEHHNLRCMKEDVRTGEKKVVGR
jgi:pyocin large subunit-like protein